MVAVQEDGGGLSKVPVRSLTAVSRLPAKESVVRTRLHLLVGATAAVTLLAGAPGPTPRDAVPTGAVETMGELAPDRVLAAVADLEAPPRATGWLAGEGFRVTGTVGVYDAASGRTEGRPLPVVLRIDGDPARALGPVVAGPDGVFAADVPGDLTAGLAPGVHAVTAHLADPVPGLDRTQATAATFVVAATADGDVVLRHQFVSSTGWVKPADDFPLTSRVVNTGPEPLTDLTVTVAAPGSVTFRDATPIGEAGTAAVTATEVTWTIPTVPAGTADGPGEVVLVTDARAAGLDADPRLVWKDLSSTATLTGLDETLSQTSHGPKVIPPSGGFETARYGDKPFPMVPVRYVDRAPQDGNDPAELDTIVNSPDFEGSTFNLYQEMSYGQLYPQGVVPSAGIASATFSEVEDDMPFTAPAYVGETCRGATLGSAPDLIGSPAFDTRITDGWYHLPGTTEYYGGDFPAFTLGTAGAIDSACGQLGKGVYDAASIADPEIDYNRFDSDRDGVVDFFMLVFVGCGGNGASQIPTPETPATNELCPYAGAPYDNIWPHSSSLEMQFRDAETGLRGFVSNDQLRSLTEVPQCYVDDSYTAFEDCVEFGGAGRDDLPVPVRVGPYNVNPETVFESASVISHEYGHHLGLPDFYNSAGFEAYSSMNLMAADYGQHMTVFSKQELGWIVPRHLQPGQEETVSGWDEVRTDTGEIHWETPDGEPYVLSTANGDGPVHNGLAWTAKLPSRQVIDPDLVAEQASGSRLLWSGRGNDFGCSPTGGHNIDVFLPELRDAPEGADVTLTMTTAWDIEWDWDYGFVLTTPDGTDYTSVPSANGYTTDNVYDPNGQQCFAETNNGLTGQSGAYAEGEPAPTLARNPVSNDYSAPLTFVQDSYDLSSLAGTAGSVRLSYFTDAAFDRPGWFVDDVAVTVDGEEVFSTDFEDGLDGDRFFNGGCGADGFRTAVTCTDGWTLIDTGDGDTSDHAYYLELRDRASFDFDGRGQSDRGMPTWQPGLFVEYTDENHGYGNNGTPVHPAQHYLDSQPTAPTSDALDPVLGSGYAECPEGEGPCDDVAFTAAEGDTTFSDGPDDPHLDNFADPDGIDGRWTFDHGCLTAEVLAMEGEQTIQEQADLVADVRLTGGAGCRAYDVAATADGGTVAGDLPARADIDVRATRVAAGQPITFDGSGSTGNPPLAFAWDLGDDTTADTEAVTHVYDRPGRYDVTLTVTDADGDVDTAGARIQVTAGGSRGETPAGAPLPATGGGLGLVALGLLGMARLAGRGASVTGVRPAGWSRGGRRRRTTR